MNILELDKEGTLWLVVMGTLAVPRTQHSEEGTLAEVDALPVSTEEYDMAVLVGVEMERKALALQRRGGRVGRSCVGEG